MSTLTLYMKSGNKIKLRYIKTWTVSGGEVITHLKIERSRLGKMMGCERLIMTSVILSQIEAITES